MKTIKLEKLRTNPNNPYKVRDDELEALKESIKLYGVIQPLIVRKDNEADTYEIVSGHRRFLAATQLGLKDVPAEVMEITKNEADILLVDSNLHRENISFSERAFAYKLKFEALKHQGKTLSQVATRSDTAAEIGKDLNESRDQIYRYIRLTYLVPELLEMVDSGKIASTPAIEISFLTEEQQKHLLETIKSEDCTPSLAQAKQMKKLSHSGMLDMNEIFRIMTVPKPNQKEMFKIPLEKVKALAPKISTAKEAEDFITKACEYYARHLNRQRDKGVR